MKSEVSHLDCFYLEQITLSETCKGSTKGGEAHAEAADKVSFRRDAESKGIGPGS